MVHASAVERRNAGSRLGRLTVAAISLALAALIVGCDDAPVASADPVRDVGAPWQAGPFRIADDTLQAAVRACRPPDGGLIPLASTLVLADVRGGNRIVLLYVGPRVESYTCLALGSTGGSFDMGPTTGGDRRSAEGPLTPSEIRPEPIVPILFDAAPGGTGSQMSIATGRIGKGIEAIDLLLGSGTSVRASTANGWYAAWWPTADQVVGYQPRALDGSPIGTEVPPSAAT
jgi:hypothetical protein